MVLFHYPQLFITLFLFAITNTGIGDDQSPRDFTTIPVQDKTYPFRELGTCSASYALSMDPQGLFTMKITLNDKLTLDCMIDTGSLIT